MINKPFYGSESWNKIFTGIEKVFKAVAPTLGSRGGNVLYRPSRGMWPKVTNDGVSVARHIFLEDESEAMGADYIKQASEKTNEQVGDGTSSVCVLAYHIIKEGRQAIESGKISAPQLRKELEQAASKAIELLSSRATKITTQEELRKIAKISSEDETIAKIVSEAITEAGENGEVLIEESSGMGTEKEKFEGFIFEQGFISPYFINNPSKLQAVFKDVNVVMLDKALVLNNDVFQMLKILADNDIRQLVIICQDAQSEALATLLENNQKMRFSSVVVKLPRDENTQKDLADYIGVPIISSARGEKFAITKIAPVRKVIVSKDKTLIVKGERTELESKNFAVAVESLKNQIDDSKAAEKKEFQKRLARMHNSTVIIRAGAPLEQEMRYLKDKIDDAVAATQAAKEEGYVTGGGLTLRTVCKEAFNHLGTEGSRILSVAAEMPVKTLVFNSGVEYDESKITETDGFDTDTGMYTHNLLEKGVIDPVKVEKSILKNATSSAAVFLTIHAHLESVYPNESSKSVV